MKCAVCSGSSDGYVKFCLSFLHAEMEEGKASITEGEQSKPGKKKNKQQTTEFESAVDKENVVTSFSHIINDFNTFGLGTLMIKSLLMSSTNQCAHTLPPPTPAPFP